LWNAGAAAEAEVKGLAVLRAEVLEEGHTTAKFLQLGR
jgi:hypothetical protein